jgi:D-alanyl-D-alanine carboxypeptidase
MRPDILSITKTAKYTLATTTTHGYHEIVSTHPFVNEPNFLGGKTGKTPQARDTMLTILNINNTPIAFIVLGSEDRKKDTLYLIEQVRKILD